MCGRFELKTKFDNLPEVLKKDYPSGLEKKYEAQNLIRPFGMNLFSLFKTTSKPSINPN